MERDFKRSIAGEAMKCQRAQREQDGASNGNTSYNKEQPKLTLRDMRAAKDRKACASEGPMADDASVQIGLEMLKRPEVRAALKLLIAALEAGDDAGLHEAFMKLQKATGK